VIRAIAVANQIEAEHLEIGIRHEPSDVAQELAERIEQSVYSRGTSRSSIAFYQASCGCETFMS
jgi:hypothetical protein